MTGLTWADSMSSVRTRGPSSSAPIVQLADSGLAWLPAVPGHGARLNGGYRSVTRTNA